MTVEGMSSHVSRGLRNAQGRAECPCHAHLFVECGCRDCLDRFNPYPLTATFRVV